MSHIYIIYIISLYLDYIYYISRFFIISLIIIITIIIISIIIIILIYIYYMDHSPPFFPFTGRRPGVDHEQSRSEGRDLGGHLFVVRAG